MRYWINTVARDHVAAGVAGGFTQADHGREGRLRRLAKGDRVVFYSPRRDQQFTAIGAVGDEAPYQDSATQNWRRQMQFLEATETPIQPLIEQLEFIKNKKSWGFTFRRGFFEISEADFGRIAQAMSAR